MTARRAMQPEVRRCNLMIPPIEGIAVPGELLHVGPVLRHEFDFLLHELLCPACRSASRLRGAWPAASPPSIRMSLAVLVLRDAFEENTTMIRRAFRMSVHSGQEDEYERRHDPIWRELEATLLAHGVQNYSIFLDAATRDLFAYVEIEDEARWEAIAQTDVCRRWWSFMRDLMPANADNSPVSRNLREV